MPSSINVVLIPNSKLSLICFRLEDWNWRVREVRDGPGT